MSICAGVAATSPPRSGGERVLERVGAVGDLALPHDAGSPFQGVGDAEEPGDHVGRRAPLELEGPLPELVDQVPRLDAEVAVRVLVHRLAQAAVCG